MMMSMATTLCAFLAVVAGEVSVAEVVAGGEDGERREACPLECGTFRESRGQTT